LRKSYYKNNAGVGWHNKIGIYALKLSGRNEI